MGLTRVNSVHNATELVAQGNEVVYIGRPSQWGNPFIIGRDGTREEVIEKYRQWITCGAGQFLLKDIEKIKGKILLCYCSPKPCHGDVLARLADEVV